MNELDLCSLRHGGGMAAAPVTSRSGITMIFPTRSEEKWTKTKHCDIDEYVLPTLSMPMRRAPHLASPNVLQGIPHTSGVTALLPWGMPRTTILPFACTRMRLWLALYLEVFCNNTKLNGDEKKEWAGDLDIENPNLHDYKYKMWNIWFHSWLLLKHFSLCGGTALLSHPWKGGGEGVLEMEEG